MNIINRRYIVDVDMGRVVGMSDFGVAPDTYTFRLERGKLRYVHALQCARSQVADFLHFRNRNLNGLYRRL